MRVVFPWDAAFCIGLPALARKATLSPTGLPLVFLVLGTAECWGILPSSMHEYGTFEFARFALLLGCIDLVQTSLHFAIHAGWLGQTVRSHHLLHHAHTTIRTEIAFATGWLDALLQLALPLLMTLAAVKPNRTTAIAFGLFYSQWLLYIHSPTSQLRVPGMVSPDYHALHHAGKGAYSHVFAVF